MMKTTYMKYIEYAITAVVLLLYGCVSERDTVSVRQVVSERSIILRIKKDKTTVFSLSYLVTFMFKKNDRKDIYYAENSYSFRNKELSSGTAACYLVPNDEDNYLTSSYRAFDGSILYIIDKNDIIQKCLSGYYNRMVSEKKDTMHVSLKYFNNNFRNIIDNFFEGDSICLHFRKSKEWHDIPLKVSFRQKLLSTE